MYGPTLRNVDLSLHIAASIRQMERLHATDQDSNQTNNSELCYMTMHSINECLAIIRRMFRLDVGWIVFVYLYFPMYSNLNNMLFLKSYHIDKIEYTFIYKWFNIFYKVETLFQVPGFKRVNITH